MTTISVNWFSFRGDADSLKVSLRAARRSLPDAKLCVWDDGGKPGASMLESDVAEIRDLCDVFELTTFDRRGNLNGVPCILGEIDCYLASVADVAIKCDCDTLFLRPGYFADAFRKDRNLLGAGIRCPKTNGFWGPCYGYRREVLPALREEMSKRCWTCPLPEDLTMSIWARQAAPSRTRIFEYNKKGRGHVGYNYRTSRTLASYVRDWDVITFGGRFAMDNIPGDQRRNFQAATMRLAWRKFLELEGLAA